MIQILLVIPILYFPLFIPVFLQLKYFRDFKKNDSKKSKKLLFIWEIISIVFYIVLFNIATNMSGWDGLIPGLSADLGIFITIVLFIVSIFIIITRYCKKESLNGNTYNPFLLCFAFILICISLWQITSDIVTTKLYFIKPEGKTIATVESVNKYEVSVSFTVNGLKYESIYDNAYKHINLYSIKSKYTKGQQLKVPYYYDGHKYFVRKPDTSEIIYLPFTTTALLILAYQFRKKIFSKKIQTK